MNNTPLFTEKSYDEAMRPLINYDGDDNYVKGSIYALQNGGDPFKYAQNYNAYKNALEDAKANDNDNFWSGVGDFFVGKSAERQKADLADEYLKAFSSNPFAFDSGSYNNAAGGIKTDADLDRGTFINGGLLGVLINPLTQTVKAGVDLAGGIGGSIGGDEHAWDAWDKRDHLADAAALGQVGLAALTAGFGTPATLGAKMGFGAATGAAENALDTIRQYGEKTDGGDLLSSAAIGGAFGAGIPLAGAGLGKITQRGTQAIANKVAPALGDDAALAFAKQAGKGTQFGAGLRDLGGSAINRFNNMSKLGKATTVGGVAAGGFGLKNLLSGNNDTYGNNYYGGY